MSAVPNIEAIEMNRTARCDQPPEQAPESIETYRLTPEQRQLAEEHMDVVYGVVGKLQGTIPLERDEMLGDGFEILCGATMSFDQSFGLPFHAYAAAMVRQRIIDKGRTSGMLGRRDPKGQDYRMPRIVSLMNGTAESLDEPPRQNDGPIPRDRECDKIADQRPDPSQEVIGQFENQAETDKLLDALTLLSDNELDILVRWLKRERVRTIAADEGVTESRISQNVTASIHLLQHYYGIETETIVPSDVVRIGVHKLPGREIHKGAATGRILQEGLGMTPRGLSNALTTLERKGLVKRDVTSLGRAGCQRTLQGVHFTPQNNVDDIRKRMEIDEPPVDITPFVAPRNRKSQ